MSATVAIATFEIANPITPSRAMPQAAIIQLPAPAANLDLQALLKYREIGFQASLSCSLASRPVEIPQLTAEYRRPVEDTQPVALPQNVREPEHEPAHVPVSGGTPKATWVCVLAVLALASASLWMRERSQAPRTPEAGAKPLVLGEGGWSTEWASDKTGSALGRQLSLF